MLPLSDRRVSVIAVAEGALYHTLNTYDRALFTFSFLQFAAHVAGGDFVVYFRALLQLPLATEYFNDLRLVNNRICRLRDNGTTIPLESDTSTAGLMDYLNPSRNEVEDTEVVQAAKFVHWAQNDPLHRQKQIEIGISHFKQNMVNYATGTSLTACSTRSASWSPIFVITDVQRVRRSLRRCRAQIHWTGYSR